MRCTSDRFYKIFVRTLEQVTEEKDLGIIIDNELKFPKHTAMAIKKANRILGLSRKSIVNLDTKTSIIQILSEATFGVW